MASNLLVSIIMPFLNTQKYLQEAIESVLAQTYFAWELLLVDDGSSDGSSEIALQYAQQYPGKVHYLEHEGHQNHGASASRNLALRRASGKYITFLDGDDVWLPSNLEHFVGILETHSEVSIAYGPTQWWYSWTGNSEDADRDVVRDLGIKSNTLVKPPELFIPFFLTRELITPCTCSLIIRREAIEAIGGFEDKFRYIYTDQVVYAKLFLKYSVFVTDKFGAKYRQHPSSSCAVVKKTGQSFEARSRFLNWLESYLSEQGIRDPEIWQALRKALKSYRYPRLHQFLKKIYFNIKQVRALTQTITQRVLLR